MGLILDTTVYLGYHLYMNTTITKKYLSPEDALIEAISREIDRALKSGPDYFVHSLNESKNAAPVFSYGHRWRSPERAASFMSYILLQDETVSELAELCILEAARADEHYLTEKDWR